MSFNLETDHLTLKVMRSFKNPIFKDYHSDLLKKYLITFYKLRGKNAFRREFRLFVIFALDEDHALDQFFSSIQSRKWRVNINSIEHVDYCIHERYSEDVQ